MNIDEAYSRLLETNARWSRPELEQLIGLHGCGLNSGEIARRVGSTTDEVAHVLNRVGLISNRVWTPDHDGMAQVYAMQGVRFSEIARRLRRSEADIRCRLQEIAEERRQVLPQRLA